MGKRRPKRPRERPPERPLERDAKHDAVLGKRSESIRAELPGYTTHAVEELARQLLMSPLAQREGYVPRIEALHDELDPAVSYPVAYVTYRATGHRTPGGDDMLLVGDALLADLRQMIADLCRSITLLPRAHEDTVESLAERLNVSTKTVHRWRKQGLRCRWVKPLGARKHRLAFPRSAVEAFQRLKPGRVQRASQRSWHSAGDKQRVIFRARRLQRETQAGISRISEHLARRTGRAKETIRLILTQHDQALLDRLSDKQDDAPSGSDEADLIFPERRSPLDDRQKRLAVRAARRGIAFSRIAERIGRSRTIAQRVVRKARYAEQDDCVLVYRIGPTFRHPDAESIFASAPEVSKTIFDQELLKIDAPVVGLPSPLDAWFGARTVHLSAVQGWIIRAHYALFAADQQREKNDASDPRAADLDTFDRWRQRADDCRSEAARRLLPVILLVCRQQLGQTARSDDAPLDNAGIDQRLVRLLITGHGVMYEALAEFDPFRGRGVSVVAYLRTRLTTHFARHDETVESTRATRRFSAEQIIQTLTQQAAAHGVRLKRENQALAEATA